MDLLCYVILTSGKVIDLTQWCQRSTAGAIVKPGTETPRINVPGKIPTLSAVKFERRNGFVYWTATLENRDQISIDRGLIYYRIVGLQGVIVQDYGVLVHGNLEPGDRVQVRQIVDTFQNVPIESLRLEIQ